MDPFNIIVNLDGQKFDLNIHPEEAATYKILYNGGLVGAITMGSDGETWTAIPVTELAPELEVPMYEYNGAEDEVRIILEGDHAQQIGRAIAQYVGT
jgi:hypothetical protein